VEEEATTVAVLKAIPIIAGAMDRTASGPSAAGRDSGRH
jgi:hypothetical protein